MLIKVSCILALVALVSSQHGHSSQYVHGHIGHEPTVYIYEPKHEAGHHHHEHKENHHEEAKAYQEVPKYYYVESNNHLGGKSEEAGKPKIESEQHHKEPKHEHKPAYSSQYFHRHDGHALPVYIHKHEEGHMKQEQHHEQAKSYHHEESNHKQEQPKLQHEELKNDHETKEQHHEYIVKYYVPTYEYEHKAEGSQAGDHKQEHKNHGGHTIKTDYSVHVQHVVPEKHHESHEKKHHR